MRLTRSRLVVVALEAAFVLSAMGAPGAAIAARPADAGNPHAAATATPDPTPPPPEPVVAPEPTGADATTAPEVAPDATPDVAPADPTVAPDPTADPTKAPATAPSDPVAAPDGTTTALDLVVTPDPLVPGDLATLTATVTPNPGCGAVVFTYNAVASAPQALDGSGVALFQVTTVAGTLPAQADFAACDTFDASTDTADVVSRYPTSTDMYADRDTAIRYEQPVTFTATVSADVLASGDVAFALQGLGGETVLGTVALLDGQASLTVANLPVGVDDVVAHFLGDGTFAPSDSPITTVTIAADTSVKTSGVGVQYTRFYPVRDDYKDTDKVRGRTLEPASVSIKIYNSHGTRVKYWALGSKNGSYSVTWTGRKSDGSLLASGTYTVKQIFKDARGNTKTVTSSVVLSHKKLYWYVSSKTRYADTGVFGWTGSAGAYKSPKFYRGVVLDGGYYEDEAAVGRYTFTLPSATIYSSVRVSVYGRSISPYGKGFMTINNWATGDLDGYRTVGYSTGWYSSSIAAADHVNSNGTVKVYVAAVGGNEGLVDYQKVKLTYKYAVLK